MRSSVAVSTAVAVLGALTLVQVQAIVPEFDEGFPILVEPECSQTIDGRSPPSYQLPANFRWQLVAAQRGSAWPAGDPVPAEVNAGDPSADAFSDPAVMLQPHGSSYLMAMVWPAGLPGHADAPAENVWRQESNPFTATRNTVSGFAAAEDDANGADARMDFPHEFLGICRNEHPELSLLEGMPSGVNDPSHWSYAIGVPDASWPGLSFPGPRNEEVADDDGFVISAFVADDDFDGESDGEGDGEGGDGEGDGEGIFTDDDYEPMPDEVQLEVDEVALWVAVENKDDCLGTAAIVEVAASDASDAYIVAVLAGAAAPSAEQVVAGVDGSGAAVVASSGAVSLEDGEAETVQFELTGLSEGTAYDIYVALLDSSGNPAGEVAALSASTLDINPPSITAVSLGARTRSSLTVDVQLSEGGTCFLAGRSVGALVPSAEVTTEEGLETGLFVDVAGGDDVGSITLDGLASSTTYELYITCRDDNDVPGPNAMTEDPQQVVASTCHAQCGADSNCDGASDTDCDTCANVDQGGRCQTQCADGYGADPSRVCQECDVFDSISHSCVTSMAVKCPPGTLMDAVSQACIVVQTTSCLEGKWYYQETQTCFAFGECPDGLLWDSVSDSCVRLSPASCAEGFVYDRTLRSCLEVTPVRCSGAQVFSPEFMVCIEECPPGQSFDLFLRECFDIELASCPAGTTYDSVGQQCLVVNDASCPEGTVYDRQTRQCVVLLPASCEYGYGFSLPELRCVACDVSCDLGFGCTGATRRDCGACREGYLEDGLGHGCVSMVNAGCAAGEHFLPSEQRCSSITLLPASCPPGHGFNDETLSCFECDERCDPFYGCSGTSSTQCRRCAAGYYRDPAIGRECLPDDVDPEATSIVALGSTQYYGAGVGISVQVIVYDEDAGLDPSSSYFYFRGRMAHEVEFHFPSPGVTTVIANYAFPEDFPEGVLTYRVQLVDRARNSITIDGTLKSEFHAQLFVDVTKPVLSSVDARGGTYGAGDTVYVLFGATDEVSAIDVYSPPVATIRGRPAEANFLTDVIGVVSLEITGSGIDSGVMTLTLSGILDLAGNEAEAYAATFDDVHLDGTRPTLLEATASRDYVRSGQVLEVDLLLDMPMPSLGPGVLRLANVEPDSVFVDGRTAVIRRAILPGEEDQPVSVELLTLEGSVAQDVDVIGSSGAQVLLDSTAPDVELTSLSPKFGCDSTVILEFTVSDPSTVPDGSVSARVFGRTAAVILAEAEETEEAIGGARSGTIELDTTAEDSDHEGPIPMEIGFRDGAGNERILVAPTSGAVLLDCSPPRAPSIWASQSLFGPGSTIEVFATVAAEDRVDEDSVSGTIFGEECVVSVSGATVSIAAVLDERTTVQGPLSGNFEMAFSDEVGNFVVLSTLTHSAQAFVDTSAPELADVEIGIQGAGDGESDLTRGGPGDTVVLVAHFVDEGRGSELDPLRTRVSVMGRAADHVETSGTTVFALYTLRDSDVEGYVVFEVDVADLAGNAPETVTEESAEDALVSLDLTRPIVPILTAEESLYSCSSEVVLSFTASDEATIEEGGVTAEIAGRPAQVDLEGYGTTLVSGTIRLQLDDSSDGFSGDVPFVVSVTDAVGNTVLTSQLSSGTAVLDCSPMEAHTVFPSSGAYHIGQRITISVVFGDHELPTYEDGLAPLATIMGITADVNVDDAARAVVVSLLFSADMDIDGPLDGNFELLVHDRAGNPTTVTHLTHNVDAVVDPVGPVLIDAFTDATYYRAGDTMQLQLSFNEALHETQPVPAMVVMGSLGARFERGDSPQQLTVEYTFDGSETQGPITYAVTVQDIALNPTTAFELTDGRISFFDSMPPEVSFTPDRTNSNEVEVVVAFAEAVGPISMEDVHVDVVIEGYPQPTFESWDLVSDVMPESSDPQDYPSEYRLRLSMVQTHVRISIARENVVDLAGNHPAEDVEHTVFFSAIEVASDVDSAVVLQESGDPAQQSYSVQLTSFPVSAVTVSLVLSGGLQLPNGDPQVVMDPAELVFHPSTWDEPQIVHIAAMDDFVDEVDDAMSMHILHGASSSDPLFELPTYEVGQRDVHTAAVEVMLIDDDVAGLVLFGGSGSEASAAVAEGASGAPLSLTLSSMPIEPVEVFLLPAVAAADASSGWVPPTVEMAPTYFEFTWETWDVPQQVLVVSVDDNVDAGDEWVLSVPFVASSGELTSYGELSGDVPLSVIDNDVAQIVTSRMIRSASEFGVDDDVLTVLALSTVPQAPVVLNLFAESDRHEVVLNSSELVLDDMSEVEVLFDIVNDDVEREAERTATITWEVADTSDPVYSLIDPASMDLSVIEDDISEIAVDSTYAQVHEGPKPDPVTAFVNVSLQAQPLADVTVNLQWDAEQIDVSVSTITFSPNDWDIPRPVAIDAVFDDLEEDRIHKSIIMLTGTSTDPNFQPPLLRGLNITVDVTDSRENVDETPAPELVSATLDDVSYTMEVLFDRDAAVEVGVPVSCIDGSIFDVATMFLFFAGGDVPVCEWITRQKLHVRYDPNSAAKGGDRIVLPGGSVRATPESIISTIGQVVLVGRTEPPKLVSATFSPNGAAIIVKFDRSGSRAVSNSAPAGPCEEVWEEASEGLLGVQSYCVWRSPTELETHFGAGALLTPSTDADAELCEFGSSLTLVPGAVRAVIDGVLSSTGCINTRGPQEVRRPGAVIDGPTVLGACADGVFSAALSFGGGGRDLSYSWSANPIIVEDETGSDSAYIGDGEEDGEGGYYDDEDGYNEWSDYGDGEIDVWEAAAPVIEAAAAAQGPLLTLPSAAMSVASRWNITLTVTTYLGVQSELERIQVDMFNGPLPAVGVAGGGLQMVAVSRQQELRATVSSAPECEGYERPRGPLSFFWSVQDIRRLDSTSTAVDVPSASALEAELPGILTKELILAPFTLSLGLEYDIAFTVGQGGVQATAVVTLRTQPLGLSLRIVGGDRDVPMDDTFSVDARPPALVDRDGGGEIVPEYEFACRTGVSSKDDVFATESWDELLALGEPCLTADGAEELDLSNFHDGSDPGLLVVPPNAFDGTVPIGAHVLVAVRASKGVQGGLVPNHFREAYDTVLLRMVSSDGAALPFITNVPSDRVNSDRRVSLSASLGDPIAVAGTDPAEVSAAIEAHAWYWFSDAGVGLPAERTGSAVTAHGRMLSMLTSTGAPQRRHTRVLRVAPHRHSGRRHAFQNVPSGHRPTGHCATRASTAHGMLADCEVDSHVHGLRPRRGRSLAIVTRTGRPPFEHGDALFASRVSASLVDLRRYTLSPGARYTFIVSATNGGAPGFASTTMEVNVPPRSGYVAALPDAGIMVETVFHLSAFNWVDDDLPLQYMLAYAPGILDPNDGSDATRSTENTVAPFARSNSVTTLLPLGQLPSRNTTIVAYVRDVLGATTRSARGRDGRTAMAHVFEQKLSNAERMAKVQASASGVLSTMLEEGSVSEMVSLTAVVASVLDGPCDKNDCSGRGLCVEPAGNCICDEGYTGEQCETVIPRHGGWSQWSEWSECSFSCGGGSRERRRLCNNPTPARGGDDCTASADGFGDVSTSICNTAACPPEVIDGGYSEWSEWSDCAVDCTDQVGLVTADIVRQRTCNSPTPTAGGQPCSVLGPAEEREECVAVCEAPLKTCPGVGFDEVTGAAVVCNGHGECLSSVEGDCRSDEPCTLSCSCDSGFAGSACQYTDEELEERKAARGALVDALSDAASATSGTATPESLNQLSGSLLSVAGSADELADESIGEALNVADAIVGASGGTGEPLETSSAAKLLSLTVSVISSKQTETTATTTEDGEGDGEDGEAAAAAAAAAAEARVDQASTVVDSVTSELSRLSTKGSDAVAVQVGNDLSVASARDDASQLEELNVPVFGVGGGDAHPDCVGGVSFDIPPGQLPRSDVTSNAAVWDGGVNPTHSNDETEDLASSVASLELADLATNGELGVNNLVRFRQHVD